MVDSSMAHLSDGVFTTAIAVYAGAMVAYTAFSLILIAQPLTQESNSATHVESFR